MNNQTPRDASWPRIYDRSVHKAFGESASLMGQYDLNDIELIGEA